MKTTRCNRPLVKGFNSTVVFLQSSKLQSFQSLQIHHIKQDDTNIAAQWGPLNCPFQEAKRSTTRLSITQCNPKRLKIEFHKAPAISQCKRWSTDSPLILHMRHPSNTMICRFPKLSIVRIFPNTADQAKNTIRNGTLFHQILLQGKGVCPWGIRP